MATKVSPKQAEKTVDLNSLRSLIQDIAARGERIPPEERARIPKDSSQHLDHYLYGTPKEESD